MGADGSVRTDTIPGYGRNSQGRWAPATRAIRCACLRRAGPPNRIHQTARGLTPGKAYCLQFVTADRNDVVGKKFNPRRYGIGVELEGADILHDKGYMHIDRRDGGRYAENNNVAKINLHRIVFAPNRRER